ncbi:hypothetical protein TNCT_253581 [Trichonephila clavata]|uniref:Uncharacterized protein n=1 Tax=Trichonephila clavata TaxID=2740835 RepID=A0A8X6GEH9_TRICU|nr:hypothetical protein TNCT_253581 [Trichonephila clavata]
MTPDTYTPSLLSLLFYHSLKNNYAADIPVFQPFARQFPHACKGTIWRRCLAMIAKKGSGNPYLVCSVWYVFERNSTNLRSLIPKCLKLLRQLGQLYTDLKHSTSSLDFEIVLTLCVR